MKQVITIKCGVPEHVHARHAHAKWALDPDEGCMICCDILCLLLNAKGEDVVPHWCDETGVTDHMLALIRSIKRNCSGPPTFALEDW